MAQLALIVDLDGTVWDSDAWYTRLAGDRAEPGLPSARMLKAAGFDESSLYRAAKNDPPPLYPGVSETLIGLPCPLGVVTNLPMWMARPMLRSVDLLDAFDSLVGYGSTRAHKPQPEPLLLCAQRLARRPAECVYVGDDPNDALAANAAGMKFAWASWGYLESPPEGCTLHLDTMAAVTGVLEEPS